MSTRTEPGRSTTTGETRIRLTGVEWSTFTKLASESTGARFAYDQRVLEIMSPGPLHESDKELMGQFVRIVARALRVPRLDMGSTTWIAPESECGLEADECFYFDREKIAVAAAALARRSNDPADYPAPDPAVEVDLSPPRLNRKAIYATLGVPEIWRFDGESLTIERLSETGSYAAVSASEFLPVRDVDALRWVVAEDKIDRSAWEDRLADWALAARPR
jgi:Uma2 family endonuclease